MFTFGGKEIYYELHGEGEPILLLNGIMMSAKSWAPFVRNFSKSNRLILLDFLDQGQSGDTDAGYSHSLQIDMIEALLGHLGLAKINICGISYGAEVGLGYAVRHPEQVRRLVLFNGAARTAPLLRDIGRSWNESAKLEGGLAYYLNTIPVIYSDSYYEKNALWMENRKKTLVAHFGKQAVKDRLVRLTDSSESFDVTKELHKLIMPVLIVGSDKDYLIPRREQELMAKSIKRSEFVILPDCGHASMYEKPMLFSALTLGFINSDSDTFEI